MKKLASKLKEIAINRLDLGSSAQDITPNANITNLNIPGGCKIAITIPTIPTMIIAILDVSTTCLSVASGLSHLL